MNEKLVQQLDTVAKIKEMDMNKETGSKVSFHSDFPSILLSCFYWIARLGLEGKKTDYKTGQVRFTESVCVCNSCRPTNMA